MTSSSSDGLDVHPQDCTVFAIGSSLGLDRHALQARYIFPSLCQLPLAPDMTHIPGLPLLPPSSRTATFARAVSEQTEHALMFPTGTFEITPVVAARPGSHNRLPAPRPPFPHGRYRRYAPIEKPPSEAALLSTLDIVTAPRVRSPSYAVSYVRHQRRSVSCPAGTSSRRPGHRLRSTARADGPLSIDLMS